YKRYVDITNAEAQAREAKIEAALEKVRSRSLAVHKTDEFNEVIKVVFERLQELEIPMASASINVIIEGSKDTDAYICGSGEDGLVVSHIRLIYFDHPIANDRYDAYEKGLDFFTKTYSAEEKNSFYEYEFEVSDLKYIPDDIKKMVMESECYTISTALTKNSMIVVNDFEGKLLSSQQIDIVKRFSKVFEQAYIRFLDLQKAEAQTREAEIELGLERVRSRAMAMQTSEELNALIGTVFTELTKLDLVLTRCVILIYEGNEKGVRWWMANSETPSTPMNFFVKYADMPFFNEYLKGWYNRELKWQYCLEAENKIKTDDFLFNETELSLLPDFVIEGMKAPDRVYLNASFNNFGNLTLATLEPLSEEHFNILLRFAKVFDLTYTRFNDLKQAEAQARESQIQLALERVRARTMAMYKSDDLAETARVLFTEFKKLNVLTDVGILDRAFISTVNEEKGVIEFWITALDGSEINRMFEGSIKEPIVFSKAYKAWKEQKKSLVIDVYGDDLIKYLNYLKSIDFPVNEELYELHRVNSVAFFSKGFIGITSLKLLPAESMQMMERFAQVFDITYTRFLDLQKAEAQTREAQIEAALEKVRSRSLAMHHSDELEQVVASLFDRLVELGLSFDGAGIFLFEKQKQNIQLWVASIHQAAPMSVNLPYDEEIENNEIYKVLWNAMEKGEHIHNRSYLGETKNDYFRYVWKHNEAKIPESIRKIHVESKTWTVSYAAEKNSIIGFDSWSGHLTSNEDFQILIRFARVFEQAYIRFLDLQKAEAQAREAQIETSLERVRSKTMAMHNSADVGETVAALFDELKKLGIETIRCGIGIMQNTKTMEVWTAKPNENNKIDLIIGHLDMNLHPLLQGAFKGWSNKEKSFSYELKQDDLINYFTAINNHPAYPVQYNIATLPSTIYHNDFFFSEGTLFAFSVTQLSDENKKICKRFAAVFGQTYRRYLDLKKAEAQAREAQIEAALERVRAKAMAMQNSNDLSIAASMVFTELRKLGINPIRYGVGLLNKESRKAQLYSVTSSSDGDSLSLVGWVMLAGHTVLENIYDTWLKNEDYYPELTGEQLKSYYENLLAGLSLPTVPNWQTTEKQYGHFFSFSVGCLYAWSNRHYSDSEIKILKRFATIIDLTFRRYLELQTSEANTREAIKQAALDRIRADIASMRTVSDLNRITPLIWNELTILGIPFIRCGVFIMNDEQQLIYTFLSTPDGKAIAAFHIPYNTLGNIKHVLSHWHDKKNYIDHWDENAFTEFASTLVTQGALTSSTQYLKTIPHGGFYLHFLPFLQGMLYVGNTTQLGEEEINLIQSVADAFSTAYARYEDFNKLEAAKQQIEKTLTDLKQTQQQLVQSEKMASLGELTAGIAHEIQNPLNFVNNFSEVSKELIDEMRIALESGDKEEAEHIASDVIQNLEKINHHGKRADAIVKNMLQHSRKSSGQKEPTDINALCDEYLRLSFHGMRAKDKNFNADFKTDFDNSIGKINVVPQNIGRVLLNLFNNAFYAVNEKKKLLANSYHPIAEVKTRRINDKVEIIVSDNGNGIPQNIIDKIFQPFFTTKPTGEGTGLGLSLSYDIITKEHNGTIKVESKEGEGTSFIINLP
ncbi:MAG TPA: ATP-binding protein, partial [Parafilimonas sp.]|nr:ATP-binding protein [Parafilimonas sp.]